MDKIGKGHSRNIAVTTAFCGIVGATVVGLASRTSAAATPPQVDDDGTIHVPAFLLPESSFLNDETRVALKKERASARDEINSPKSCAPDETADATQMPAIRKCQAEAF
jgi:hypothetical protein